MPPVRFARKRRIRREAPATHTSLFIPLRSIHKLVFSFLFPSLNKKIRQTFVQWHRSFPCFLSSAISSSTLALTRSRLARTKERKILGNHQILILKLFFRRNCFILLFSLFFSIASSRLFFLF